MSTICIIPARSGSVRLPNKNLRPFCWKPLLEWTLEQALRLKNEKIIDEVVLTTDYAYEEMRAAGISIHTIPTTPHGPLRRFVDVFYHARRHSLVGPDVPMAKVIADVLASGPGWPSLVVLLQPTSPTRTDEAVRRCIQKARNAGDLCFTVYPGDPPGRCANGACYAFPPHRMPSGDPGPLAESGDISGFDVLTTDDIDINTVADFEAAEKVMRERLAQ